MTRTQAVGVMLVALGLIYAALYAAWLRKRRRHGSATVAVADPGAGGGGPAAKDEQDEPDEPDERPGPALVQAEGTYVSTTAAASRHERVAVEGLGNRSRATLTVHRGAPERLVHLHRHGERDLTIGRHRLVGIRRDRGMAGKFVGANRLLVLQWRADDGSIYETTFLPRYRADLERIESALWWHHGSGSLGAHPEHHQGATGPDSTPPTEEEPRT